MNEKEFLVGRSLLGIAKKNGGLKYAYVRFSVYRKNKEVSGSLTLRENNEKDEYEVFIERLRKYIGDETDPRDIVAGVVVAKTENAYIQCNTDNDMFSKLTYRSLETDEYIINNIYLEALCLRSQGIIHETETQVNMVEKRTVSTFNAINLFQNLRSVLKYLGFKKILMSDVTQNEKLHIWFVAPDIKTLNRFLWAGCHRYFNLHECQLFSVHIDHGDPDSTSSELRLVMSTNEVFTEDKLVDLEDFVKGVNDFAKYLDSLDTDKETPVGFLEGEHVKMPFVKLMNK